MTGTISKRKRVLVALAALLVVLVAALASTFMAKTLDVDEARAIALPAAAKPPAEMRVRALLAGSMSSKAAFAFRGGSFSDERVFSMGGVLVEHPRGSLLFDTGFGRNARTHIEGIPWLMRATTTFELGTPIADQLRDSGFDTSTLSGIVPTHVHWDHISGVPDFPNTPIWLPRVEHAFIESGGMASELMRSFGKLNVREYDFPHGAYLGYDKSFDVFSDGSVVLVQAGGHTPGSIVAFITDPQGRKLALIGDLAWQQEGVELPTERPWVSRTLVDFDAARVRDEVTHLHRIQRLVPELIVVPAHEPRAWAKLVR
jgi:glyoxylase-like metal-dependent hydrolase (beta-lactamase superfamily II)